MHFIVFELHKKMLHCTKKRLQEMHDDDLLTYLFSLSCQRSETLSQALYALQIYV